MNKTSTIILTSILLIIVLGLSVYFLFGEKNAGTSSLRSVLPFGLGGENTQNGPVTPPNNSEQVPAVENIPTVEANGLQKISDGPVSGFTIVTQGSSTIIRFMDRGTGNIFDFDTITNVKKRITNTTIPKAVSVSWGERGNTFIAQTIKDGVLSSYSATIASSTSTTSDSLRGVTGEYIPDDILSLSFSPKKDSVFYLQKTYAGISGFIADRRGKNEKEIWKFATDEWFSSWPTGDTVFLTTKASSGAKGFMFNLNTKTGALTPVLSHIPGLTTRISPDGKTVLY